MHIPWDALIIASLMAGATGADAAQAKTPRSPLLRIRPMHVYVEHLLKAGERSPTFARLLAEIDRSSVIVYIDLDMRADDDRHRAGALFFVGAAGKDRWLRIQLYTHTTSWLRTVHRQQHLVATLAHELQHAREVASDESVRDQASFAALFRARGFKDGLTKRHAVYETHAAREVGSQVFEELRSP